MNLSAIKRLCLDNGEFTIINAVDGQWIGNGSCFYPVDGVELHEDGVPALFDLTPKKADECNILERPAIDRRFSIMPQDDDTPMTPVGMGYLRGNLYIALKDEQGMLYIPKAAMKPVKWDAVNYFSRGAGGLRIVAVFGDLFCSALICPVTEETAEQIRAEARAVLGMSMEDTIRWKAMEEAGEVGDDGAADD